MLVSIWNAHFMSTGSRQVLLCRDISAAWPDDEVQQAAITAQYERDAMEENNEEEKTQKMLK